MPACNGGQVKGQTNCRCKGQKETCDLWTCPGGAPNVVSPSSPILRCIALQEYRILPQPSRYKGLLTDGTMYRWSAVKPALDVSGFRQLGAFIRGRLIQAGGPVIVEFGG